jgi:hypothetical protein
MLIWMQAQACCCCCNRQLVLCDHDPLALQVCRGVHAMVDIVKASQQRGKPSPGEWQMVAKDLGERLAEAQQLGGGPRKASVNHDKAVSESMQGLIWVTFDPAMPGMADALPAAGSSAQVTCNRLASLHLIVLR